jgi:hypothetical protein
MRCVIRFSSMLGLAELNKGVRVVVVLLAVCTTKGVLAEGSRSSRKAPRAIPVEEDLVRFDNSVLGAAPVYSPNIKDLPDFGQHQDNYGIPTKSNAEYFRVPESVRAERDIARRINLKKAQLTLYRYLKSQREALFGEQDHTRWEREIQKEAAFLEEVFFSLSTDTQNALLQQKFKENPALKSALSYFGIFRVHGIHGKLGTQSEIKVLRAKAVDAPPEGEEPTSNLILFEAAPAGVLEAQKIERGFHEFPTSPNSYSPLCFLCKKLFYR